MKSIEIQVLKCPCCHERRRYGEFQHLYLHNYQFKRSGVASLLEGAINSYEDTYWACDICLDKKRAIPGKPELQNVIGFVHPFVAYYDRERKCVSCGVKFIFSKEEQQYWYEELKFITWSVPKNCPGCRKEQRKPRVRNT